MVQELTPGQVVISKSGRDKGRYFILVKVEGQFVYIVDGDLRKIENPKKKNKLHVKATNIVQQDIVEKLNNCEAIKNLDFRKALTELNVSSGK